MLFRQGVRVARGQGARVAHSVRVPRATAGAVSVSAVRSPAAAPVVALRLFSAADGASGASLDVTQNADGTRYLVTIDNTLFSVDANETVASFARQVKDEENAELRVVTDAKGPRYSGGNRLADALASGCTFLIDSKAFAAAPQAPLSGEAAAVASAVGGSGGTAWNPSRAELDELKSEFIPLFQRKRELDNKSQKSAERMLWGGMAYYSLQTLFLARLTWWEFNWDIMEPVTYFITVGTGVASFAYFNIQKSEYTYDHLRGVMISKRMFKNYVSNDFPIDKYFELEDKIHKANPSLLAEIEYDIEQNEYEAKMGVPNA
jgi:Mitochondrial calcium uniporter